MPFHGDWRREGARARAPWPKPASAPKLGPGPDLPLPAAPLAPLAELVAMGERPADDHEDREVHDADRVRVEIAELLPDLPVDLERRHRRTDETDLEERRLRGDVRSGAPRDHAARRGPADDDRVGPDDDRCAAGIALRGEVADREM